MLLMGYLGIFRDGENLYYELKLEKQNGIAVLQFSSFIYAKII